MKLQSHYMFYEGIMHIKNELGYVVNNPNRMLSNCRACCLCSVVGAGKEWDTCDLHNGHF